MIIRKYGAEFKREENVGENQNGDCAVFAYAFVGRQTDGNCSVFAHALVGRSNPFQAEVFSQFQLRYAYLLQHKP